MTLTENKTIGEIVSEDFRTAAIFKKYGIDFCCKGNRSVEEACSIKKINPEKIYQEISDLAEKSNVGDGIDFKTFPLDLLADYVEKVHHRYIEEKIPILLQFLDKVSRVHGGNHPELIEVYQLFNASAQDLSAHLRKEELILFPFIRAMISSERSGQPLQDVHFGTVASPVEMMMHEHDIEGDRFRKIAELTSNYQPPAEACSTYATIFKMLEEFENDLHKHIHIENNILFPKAIALEQRLRQQ